MGAGGRDAAAGKGCPSCVLVDGSGRDAGACAISRGVRAVQLERLLHRRAPRRRPASSPTLPTHLAPRSTATPCARPAPCRRASRLQLAVRPGAPRARSRRQLGRSLRHQYLLCLFRLLRQRQLRSRHRCRSALSRRGRLARRRRRRHAALRQGRRRLELQRRRRDDRAAIAGFPTTATSGIRWGWMLGAGAERALSQHWSLKAEYDYLSFGSAGSGDAAAATSNRSRAADPNLT